jgi:hypothetical protein
MLTEAGRAALREWIARPTPFPRIQSEAMVKLTAGDFADDATLLRACAACGRSSTKSRSDSRNRSASRPRSLTESGTSSTARR